MMNESLLIAASHQDTRVSIYDLSRSATGTESSSIVGEPSFRLEGECTLSMSSYQSDEPALIALGTFNQQLKIYQIEKSTAANHNDNIVKQQDASSLVAKRTDMMTTPLGQPVKIIIYF